MRGKNVALSAEVIELLDQAKRKNESYSEVVMRLVHGPRPMKEALDAIEALGPVEDDSLDRIVAELRRVGRGGGRRVRKPRNSR